MGVAPRELSDYRIAFDEFAQKVRQAQALMEASNPDWRAIDAALLDLEKARVVYNHRRDVLAQQLMKSAPVSASNEPSADRVREIAELRWELAGKPDGTADDDWYRAEEIVRRAVAA
jgi:hypothetical protein